MEWLRESNRQLVQKQEQVSQVICREVETQQQKTEYMLLTWELQQQTCFAAALQTEQQDTVMVSILTTISKTHSEWLKTQTSMSLKSLRFWDDNIKPSRTWQTDEEPRISKKEFYSVALNLGYTGFFCLLASFKLALCGPSSKKIERFVEAKGDSVLWLLLIQPRQILDKSSRYPPLLIQKDMQPISKYSPSSCRCRM